MGKGYTGFRIIVNTEATQKKIDLLNKKLEEVRQLVRELSWNSDGIKIVLDEAKENG